MSGRQTRQQREEEEEEAARLGEPVSRADFEAAVEGVAEQAAASAAAAIAAGEQAQGVVVRKFQPDLGGERYCC
eukprot:COSAG01_NODE_1425_length_10350_cov_38.096283_7_plen_74_part_00